MLVDTGLCEVLLVSAAPNSLHKAEVLGLLVSSCGRDSFRSWESSSEMQAW